VKEGFWPWSDSPGAQATEHRIEAREIRSYESEYVEAEQNAGEKEQNEKVITK
jgi:hypothetical protein